MQFVPPPLRRPRRAAVAVQVALTITVVMGMFAVVIDGGVLLAQRRLQQAAADSAALAYAAAMDSVGDPTVAQRSALAIAKANGAGNDGTNSLIIPNATDASGNPSHGIWSPPLSGPFAGKKGYVEVVLEYDEARMFSAFWGSARLPVRARAVASWSATANYWDKSILALGTSQTDISDSAARITVQGPIISDGSISLQGSGSITSKSGPINFVGTASGSAYSPSPTKLSTTTSDPLTSIALPDPSELTVQSSSKLSISSSTTLQPGIYQGGINITAGTVTLKPGIYYLEGGGLTVKNSGTTLTDGGAGVLIYNGETSGSTSNPGSVGSIQISNSAVVNLTPLNSGTWQGISFFQDRSATTAMTISGGSSTNIGGMIYAPGAGVSITGGSGGTPGTSFISKTLSINGTTYTIPAATVKVPLPGSVQTSVVLVE
jgi:hypothetical protein